jgi:SnoaL-like protein
MGDVQQRNLAAARAFYDAGPAATDEERRAFFASYFIWHVPGDTDLSGPYTGEDYFTKMPARMQPLDQWDVEIQQLAANEDLVVAVGRLQGRRLGRSIGAVCGHVLRYDRDSHIAEAWGWCSDQQALDEFFA